MKSAFTRFEYWALCLLILTSWIIGMFYFDQWHILPENWPLSVTMIAGSFIAGATAEGGGAVAFPVFTKLFQIEPSDARTFSFMIQSVGMTMAGAYIWLSRITILKNVLFIGVISGSVGVVVGTEFSSISGAMPKLLFSFIAALFGFFLLYNRYRFSYEPRQKVSTTSAHTLLLIIITFIGGWVSSVIGVGIDILLFIVLTLAFRINEKVSTPTTVILMGLISLVGFAYHGWVQKDIAPHVWSYWLSCVPIVIFGAPLGAWACYKIKRDHLIYGLLFLIAVELTTTLWLIPISAQQALWLSLMLLVSAAVFGLFIRIGRNQSKPTS